MMAIVFSQAGSQLQAPLGRLTGQIATWLLPGMFQTDFNDDPQPGLIRASVTWSLQFEWLFYLSLPFTAIAARRDWAHLPFAAAGLLAVVPWRYPTAFDIGPVAVLAAAFYLIVSGCTVFGILTTRAARRLGDVSYGIYLQQGLVLALMFASAGARTITLASPCSIGSWRFSAPCCWCSAH
jgi:peptidoglycan/LPS O-acetylase OafA/YrhL